MNTTLCHRYLDYVLDGADGQRQQKIKQLKFETDTYVDQQGPKCKYKKRVQGVADCWKEPKNTNKVIQWYKDKQAKKEAKNVANAN